MSTRREFLSSIPLVWVPILNNQTAQDEKIDLLVSELSSALEARHGGRWKVTKDSKNAFVMVCRQ